MAVATKLMTAEEFWERAKEFEHCELVKGQVVPKHELLQGGTTMSPTGGQHAEIELTLGSLLREFLRRRKIGKAYSGEVGFVLTRNPDVVRAPDLAFVSLERLPKSPRGFIPLPPDLAVEIVSPHDTVREIQSKVIEYLGAGTHLVWIVDPDTQTITVYRSLSDVRVLTDKDTLDGADVLPGFSVVVKEIFE